MDTPVRPSMNGEPALYSIPVEKLHETTDLEFSDNNTEEKFPQKTSKGQENLDLLLKAELELGEVSTREVIFDPPLISRDGTGIIRKNTINIIQGAYGSHKSRLAELVGALILAINPNALHFLGFVRATLERFCLCYIDSERNKREELPFAIQGIKSMAGYSLAEKPREFRFTSIKPVRDRKDRFDAIEAFITNVRQKTSLHLFCIIDVATDIGGDFNDSKEAMKLLDFIGYLCDEQNATFLLVIHQNPGTDKARGHTGTEAANKASTVIQIGYDRDGKGDETELIRLRYLKLRRSKRPEPLYLQYSDINNGLVLADSTTIADSMNGRKQKALIDKVANHLANLLADGPLPKHEVWQSLINEFNAGESTIRGRIKDVKDQQPTMYDKDGFAAQLDEFSDGRNQFFQLVRLVDSDSASC
jgi:hypothetical protein